MVADERGREHICFTSRDCAAGRPAGHVGRARPGSSGARAGRSAVSMRASDYDRASAPGTGRGGGRPQPGKHPWTEPYLFYTAGAPGITCGDRVRRARPAGACRGRRRPADDISTFTPICGPARTARSRSSTEEGRVIGLPHEVGDRDAPPSSRRS